MSSPSVAYYHVGKLVKSGLIKEEGSGYVADKFVFENMVRVRKTALPLQSAYAVLFLAALALLVTILRPAQITSQYAFSVVMIVIGFGISAFEAYRTLSKEIL
ncbi:MAG: helix-turn-helix transcriptional regulator [Thaumarchaeota archaeon]|nr:helix-turn-helix transcriptional regulator [Nitrososphaerota archaeon]